MDLTHCRILQFSASESLYIVDRGARVLMINRAAGALGCFLGLAVTVIVPAWHPCSGWIGGRLAVPGWERTDRMHKSRGIERRKSDPAVLLHVLHIHAIGCTLLFLIWCSYYEAPWISIWSERSVLAWPGVMCTCMKRIGPRILVYDLQILITRHCFFVPWCWCAPVPAMWGRARMNIGITWQDVG